MTEQPTATEPDEDEELPPSCESCEDVVDDESDLLLGQCDECIESTVDDYSFYCEGCCESYVRFDDRPFGCPWDNWRRMAEWVDRPFAEIHFDEHSGCTYCESCAPESDDRIHDYGYKPDPIFHNLGSEDPDRPRKPAKYRPYFGMELEANGVVQNMDDAESIYGQAAYFKEDSSLGKSGAAELVTHPASLAWHQANLNKVAMDRARAGGMDTDRDCGIHIHVNLASFTQAHLFRFLTFHFANPTICEIAGGRKSTYYASWDNWTRWDERKKAIKMAKREERQDNRYSAINLHNSNTVELRYFGSSTRPNDVLAKLEWVHAVWSWTGTLTTKDLAGKDPAWEDMREWLRREFNRHDRYDHLREVLDRDDVMDGVTAPYTDPKRNTVVKPKSVPPDPTVTNVGYLVGERSPCCGQPLRFRLSSCSCCFGDTPSRANERLSCTGDLCTEDYPANYYWAPVSTYDF